MADGPAKTARAEWGTRFGFLMAMIGAMVGAGNIWRFPYVMGNNGGGAFVLAFLMLLFVLAVPGLMAEVALGRYTSKGVLGPTRLRLLTVNRNAGIYVGRWWDPVIKYVVPAVMLFIMAYFAWENYGTDEMIGGMVVLVSFPVVGYVLMSVLEGRRGDREPAGVTGGDD